MSTHYNAFISYRHVPRDIRIAEMLQKKLEHYRIPRAIQAQTGIRRFDRIFRDKEELPVTSDLNERITEALHNSDYLIVICSEDSVNSRWMQREITTFLQTHSRRQVLTILAGGDPEEVIPEVLRYGESVWQDADSRAAPAEPLYGDLSSPSRRNRNSEVHRIAAAMLGCSYDDLIQRQRRYRQRRLTAALCTAAVVLGLLAAYFLWTSLQIRESYLRSEQNYQQALANQSRYLASEALALLEAGDRTTALQLALAALPSEDLQRPLIPEAEYALTQALHAYSTQEMTTQAVNSFVHKSNVRDFFLPENSDRLWVMDTEYNLYLWSTVDFSLIRKWAASELSALGLNSPILRQLGQERVLLASSLHQLCLDALDGSVLWEQNHNMFAASATPLMEGAKIGFNEVFKHSIYILDAQTGDRETEFAIPDDVFPEDADTLKLQFLLSPDGRYLAVCCSSSPFGSVLFYGDALCHLLIRDNLDGSWRSLSLPGHVFSGIMFCPSGELLVLTQNYIDGDNIYTSYSAVIDGVQYYGLYPNDLNTSCIAPDSGTLLWQHREVYSLLSAAPSAVFLRFPLQSGDTVDAVCCSAANRSYVYSIADGKQLADWQLPAAILNTAPGDSAIGWILDNGLYAYRNYDSDHISAIRVLADNAATAKCRGNQIFMNASVSSGKRTILMYDTIPADSSWQLFREEPELEFSDFVDAVTSGSKEVILYEDDCGRFALNVHDLDTGSFCFSVLLQEDRPAPAYVQLIRADAQEALVFRSYDDTQNTRNELLRISLADGSISVQLLPGEKAGRGCVFLPESGSLVYAAGNCWYRTEQDGSFSEGVITEDAGSYLRKVIPDTGSGSLFCCYRPSLSDSTAYCCLVDSGGAVLPLPTDAQELTYLRAEFSPDGQLLAVSGNDRVQLLNREGSEIGSIPLDGRSVSSVRFLNDNAQIAVLCDTGELLLFRIPDCTLLREARLESSGWRSYYSWQDIRWTLDSRGRLIIIRPCYSAAVIDLEYWSRSATVEHCADYIPERNLFLSCRQSGLFADLGYIRQYTAEELVLRARSLLAGAQLTEEQKLHYGIS